MVSMMVSFFFLVSILTAWKFNFSLLTLTRKYIYKRSQNNSGSKKLVWKCWVRDSHDILGDNKSNDNLSSKLEEEALETESRPFLLKSATHSTSQWLRKRRRKAYQGLSRWGHHLCSVKTSGRLFSLILVATLLLYYTISSNVC